MLFLRDRLMCHLVWPICRRMPVSVYAAVTRVAAVPFAGLLLWRKRQLVSGAAKIAGRSRVTMALQMAWYRLRYLDYYFYGGVPHLKIEWPGGIPETERCLYVLANTYGSETISPFMDRYPSLIVRMPFGSEGETTYATARKGFRWYGRLAEVREAASHGRLVSTEGSPLQYRTLAKDSRNVVIYQDLWHEEPQRETFPFLGRQVSLKLGSLKLARMCGGLPIRYLSIRPHGKWWVVRVSPRLPAEDTGRHIAQHVEAEILERPGAWELWEGFLKTFG